MSDQRMYRWRRMTDKQRAAVVKYRQSHCLPRHSPPHFSCETGVYLTTAACFEHRHIVGRTPQRTATFERLLLETCAELCAKVFAWTILPNHYHILVKANEVKALLRRLGQLHGRSSFQWNREENCRGRKVWFNATETGMKSERHFWASLLYVLHNAVKHGYVTRSQDWPFCNAQLFLDRVGREQAGQLWKEYPIDEYGAQWDPPDL